MITPFTRAASVWIRTASRPARGLVPPRRNRPSTLASRRPCNWLGEHPRTAQRSASRGARLRRRVASRRPTGRSPRGRRLGVAPVRRRALLCRSRPHMAWSVDRVRLVPHWARGAWPGARAHITPGVLAPISCGRASVRVDRRGHGRGCPRHAARRQSWKRRGLRSRQHLPAAWPSPADRDCRRTLTPAGPVADPDELADQRLVRACRLTIAHSPAVPRARRCCQARNSSPARR